MNNVVEPLASLVWVLAGIYLAIGFGTGIAAAKFTADDPMTKGEALFFLAFITIAIGPLGIFYAVDRFLDWPRDAVKRGTQTKVCAVLKQSGRKARPRSSVFGERLIGAGSGLDLELWRARFVGWC